MRALQYTFLHVFFSLRLKLKALRRVLLLFQKRMSHQPSHQQIHQKRKLFQFRLKNQFLKRKQFQSQLSKQLPIMVRAEGTNVMVNRTESTIAS